jgi:hypothetical protein
MTPRLMDSLQHRVFRHSTLRPFHVQIGARSCKRRDVGNQLFWPNLILQVIVGRLLRAYSERPGMAPIA